MGNMPRELDLEPLDNDAVGQVNKKERHQTGGRTVIISYRLPVAKKVGPNQEVTWEPTVGGMATAIRQALKNGADSDTQALWLGWLGETGETQGLEEALNPAEKVATGNGYLLHPVDIPPPEFNGFYYKTANMGIWPAFHGYDLKIKRNSQEIEEGWPDFVSANRRFAQEYIKVAKPDDQLFVQDYQLALVAQALRELGYTGRINYFLHIPFPKPDTFDKLPHAQDLLRALLQYDRIGFQTEKDKANFEACVSQLPEKPQRQPFLEVTPISIDPQEFIEASQKEKAQNLLKQLREDYEGQKIMFTGGRLDYTKGFVESVWAYQKALKNHPELRGKTVFIIAAATSRGSISDYLKYTKQLNSAIDKVNDQFGTQTWQPVVTTGELKPEEMAAYYMAADVNLAGSRADGMNLTPKEAIAASSTLDKDHTGVVVISSGAGASKEFEKGALIFDPASLEDQAETMAKAFAMPIDERLAGRQINEAALWANTISDWTRRNLAPQTP